MIAQPAPATASTPGPRDGRRRRAEQRRSRSNRSASGSWPGAASGAIVWHSSAWSSSVHGRGRHLWPDRGAPSTAPDCPGAIKPGGDPPSLAHIFGTDGDGRDVFALVINGARISMAVGVFSTLIAGFVGVAIGTVAGYVGGSSTTS